MTGTRGKVKTGCRTCKSRKVKCDETFPECTRCLHTGRLCGGYGIWGGGSSGHANHVIKTRPSTTCHSPRHVQHHNNLTISHQTPRAPPPLISSAISTAHDRDIFDYYLRLASTKLPGSFSHDFWSHAVIPASLSEPAVLHAVLALSCTHKRGVLTQPQSPLTTASTTDSAHGRGMRGDLETLALRHYIKAIGHLKPHFEAKDATSTKVALVVCVVFMTLDCFAGRWIGARRHLETGLRLLRETFEAVDDESSSSSPQHAQRNDLDTSVFVSLVKLRQPRTMVDKWLIHVFTSLQIQFGLFSPPSEPFLLPVDIEDEKRMVFDDLLDAWHCLQRLLTRAMHLESVSKSLSEQPDRQTSSTTLQFLAKHQDLLRADVNKWLITIQASSKTITAECNQSFETRKAYHVVMAYHRMVAIKTETCLRSIPPPPLLLAHPLLLHNYNHNPESAFTTPTTLSNFHNLLTHLCNLWSLAAPPPQYHFPSPTATTTTTTPDSHVHPLPHSQFDTLRSMMDFGWIPILHFIAIKCRIPTIRTHALGFLQRVYHREGIWDGRVIAAIAEKIIALENRGFSDGIGSDHDMTKAIGGEAVIPLNLAIPPPTTLEDLLHQHQQQCPENNRPIPIQNQLIDVEMILSGDDDLIVQSVTLVHTLLPSSSSSPPPPPPSPNWPHNAPLKSSQKVALAQYNLQTGTWRDDF